MTQLRFYKYHGTGNDFIIIDNRKNEIVNIPDDLIKKLCHRRFGIGADGLILLQTSVGFDFEMVYFNADGNPGSMCGNGGRCIVAFARKMGIKGDNLNFLTSDGEHVADILSYNTESDEAMVSLKMQDVDAIENGDGFYFLDTGSPHYVSFVDNTERINVLEEGRKIRNSPRFIKEGTNVNFVHQNNNQLTVRTYERGVEDETWSCGTGVTAAALVASAGAPQSKSFDVKTRGGDLTVRFEKIGHSFRSIYLEGAAKFVFEGVLNLN